MIIDDSPEKTLAHKVERFRTNSDKAWKNFRALNWIGYGCLLFSLIDTISILVPSKFKDSLWEFGVVGNLVERSFIPLIGFGLVFVGDYSLRSKLERLALKILSYFALILGITYFFLMVFGISSTIRIDRMINERITQQAGETRTKLEQVQTAFQSVKTIDQMEVFLSHFDRQGKAPAIKNDRQFKTAKQRFSELLNQGQKQLNINIQETQSTQRNSLLKNSLKWNLGALLSGFLFFSIWRSTAAARQRH